MVRQQELTPEQRDLVDQAVTLGGELARIQAELAAAAGARSAAVLALADSGLSLRRIAAEIGTSIGPVQDAIRRARSDS
jgi:DNA-directed RNA polymerase specialized sigma24 family protein